MSSFESHAVAFTQHLRAVIDDEHTSHLPGVVEALQLDDRDAEATDWVLEIEELRDTSGSGAHVLRIRNAADLAVWAGLVAEQLPADRAVADALASSVQQAGFGSDASVQAYYARLDGIPVGTSLAASFDGVGGVHVVTTAPDARRRGIGRALAEKAIRGGETVGAEHAVVRAPAASRKNCERMGFQPTS